MKCGIQFILVVISVLGIARLAESTVAGNLADTPLAGGWTSGVEIDFLEERDFSDSRLSSGSLDAESKRYLWAVSYGLTDEMSLKAKIGTADLNLQNSEAGIFYGQGSNLAWGAGLNFNFYENPCFGLKVGSEAHYFAFKPDVYDNPAVGRFKSEWSEWQVSTSFSLTSQTEGINARGFTITSKSLYAGVKYSNVNLDWEMPCASGTLKADENLSPFAGFSLTLNEKFALCFQASFQNETAYSIGIGYRETY